MTEQPWTNAVRSLCLALERRTNALNRVRDIANALETRYPDASPELQAVLDAIATDIRDTITDALKGDQA